MPSLTKTGKRYEELLDEQLKENKKLERINQKIEKLEIIERIGIKEVKSKILDEAKAFKRI